jgi:hypothetical protein
VLVTTCYKPSKTMFTFLAEMLVRRGMRFSERERRGIAAARWLACVAPCWRRCWCGWGQEWERRRV